MPKQAREFTVEPAVRELQLRHARGRPADGDAGPRRHWGVVVPVERSRSGQRVPEPEELHAVCQQVGVAGDGRHGEVAVAVLPVGGVAVVERQRDHAQRERDRAGPGIRATVDTHGDALGVVRRLPDAQRGPAHFEIAVTVVAGGVVQRVLTVEREGGHAQCAPVAFQGPGADQDDLAVVHVLPDAQLDEDLEGGGVNVLLSGGVTRRGHGRGDGREQQRDREERAAQSHRRGSLHRHGDLALTSANTGRRPPRGPVRRRRRERRTPARWQQ